MMKAPELERALDELRRALVDLVDLQNGPPLESDRKEWVEAMKAAAKALGEDRYGLEDDHGAR